MGFVTVCRPLLGIFKNELSVEQEFSKLASLLLTDGMSCCEVIAVRLHTFLKVYNPL